MLFLAFKFVSPDYYHICRHCVGMCFLFSQESRPLVTGGIVVAIAKTFSLFDLYLHTIVPTMPSRAARSFVLFDAAGVVPQRLRNHDTVLTLIFDMLIGCRTNPKHGVASDWRRSRLCFTTFRVGVRSEMDEAHGMHVHV